MPRPGPVRAPADLTAAQARPDGRGPQFGIQQAPCYYATIDDRNVADGLTAQAQ